MAISQKPVKFAAIHNVLNVAWAKFGSVTISCGSDNVVLFKIEDEKNRK